MLLMQTIKKDFLAYRKTLIYIPLYILVFPCFFVWLGDKTQLFTMITILCNYMWLGSVLAYDEKYKADSIIGILPVKRSTVLLGKVIMTDLVLLGVTAVYILLSLANAYFPARIFEMPTLSHFAAGAFCSGLMMLAIMPACYKWGYQKSRVVMILILVVVIMFFSGAMSFIDAATKNPISGMMENPMNREFPIYVSCLILAASVLFQIIAYVLSYRQVRKKDV